MPAAQAYTVPLDDRHYRELLMRNTTPPATAQREEEKEGEDGRSALLMMGFPSRVMETGWSLCACHSEPRRGGYLCSRCGSKVCALPTECPACGLTLILSTHLARSYHHLFPLRNWKTVSWERAADDTSQSACFSCLTPFPGVPALYSTPKSGITKAQRRGSSGGGKGARKKEGMQEDNSISESGRYECGTCARFFCIDCDVFAHEVVHNCPGCQSREGVLMQGGENEVQMDGG